MSKKGNAKPINPIAYIHTPKGVVQVVPKKRETPQHAVQRVKEKHGLIKH